MMHFWTIFWLSIVNHQSRSCVFDAICICLLSYCIHLHNFTSGKLTQTILGHRATLESLVSLKLSLQPCQRRPHVHPQHWNPHPGNAPWRWQRLKTPSCHAGDGTFYLPCKERGKLGNTKPYLQIRKSKAAINLSDFHPNIPQPRMTHRSHVPRTSWASCNTVVQFHPCQWKRCESTMGVMDGFTFGIHRHPLGSFGTKGCKVWWPKLLDLIFCWKHLAALD